MSLANKSLQLCPHCQSMQEVSYYQSVNVTINPELKQKVLSGILNINICTACNKEISIVSGFLYHDMTNRIMLELALDENAVDEGKDNIIRELVGKGYIYRKVHEYGRLIEKINIFDQQLNDKIVSDIAVRMTSALQDSLKKVGQAPETIAFTVIFDKIEKSLFKKEIAFHCFMQPGQRMQIKYNLKRLYLDEKRDLFNMDLLRNQSKV